MPHFSKTQAPLFHAGLASELPEQLRVQPRWILWKLTDEGIKTPIGRSGRAIDAQQPTNWRPFEDAIGEAEKRNNTGLGFALVTEKELTSSDPSELWVVCVDADNAFLNSSVETEEDASKRICREWAQAIVNRFAGTTYVEVSPSGRGLKFFFLSTTDEIQAALAKYDSSSIRKVITTADQSDYTAKSEMIELFVAKRYLAVTSLPYAGSEAVLKVVKLDELISFIDETAKQFGCQTEEKPKRSKRTAKQSSHSYTDNPSWPPIEERVTRCKSYLSTYEQAIQGQNGSAVTLKAMGKISQFGLRPDSPEAWDCAQHYNQSRCMPPWNERDLRKKLRDTEVHWGAKLDEPRNHPTKHNFDLDQEVDLSCFFRQPTKQKLLHDGYKLYSADAIRNDSTQVDFAAWCHANSELAERALKPINESPIVNILHQLIPEVQALNSYSHRNGIEPAKFLAELREAAITKQGNLFDDLQKHFSLFDSVGASVVVAFDGDNDDDDEERIPYNEPPQVIFDLMPQVFADFVNWQETRSYRPVRIFSLSGGIAVFSAACAHRFEDEKSETITSYYCMHVGPTSSGKDTFRKAATAVLAKVNWPELSTSSWFTSDSSLFEVLEQNNVKLIVCDEFHKTLKFANNPTNPMFLVNQALTTLYSSNYSECHETTRRVKDKTKRDKESHKLWRPTPIVVGMLQPSQVRQGVSVDNVLEGFMPRFHVVIVPKRGEYKDEDEVSSNAPPPKSVVEFLEFAQAITCTQAERNPIAMTWSDEGKAAYKEWTTLIAKKEQDNSIRGDMWARVREKAKPLARLHAVLTNKKHPVVTRESVLWATEFTNYTTESMINLYCHEVISTPVEKAFAGMRDWIRGQFAKGITEISWTKFQQTNSRRYQQVEPARRVEIQKQHLRELSNQGLCEYHEAAGKICSPSKGRNSGCQVGRGARKN